MVIKTIAYLFGKVRDAMGQAAGDDRGIGVVEVILILVGICIADKSRILCGNFRCI